MFPVTLDTLQVAELVAGRLALLVGQLPAHIGTAYDAAAAFFSLFGPVESIVLLTREPPKPSSPHNHHRAIIRYRDPRSALAAKATLDQLFVPPSAAADRPSPIALDVAWIDDVTADTLTQTCSDLGDDPAMLQRRKKKKSPERNKLKMHRREERENEEEGEQPLFTWCLLSNMFDPAEEADNEGPNWADGLRADVMEQVSLYEPIEVYVDTWSSHGRVLIHLLSEDAAVRCAAAIDGRVFSGRTVRAAPLLPAQAHMILRSGGREGGGDSLAEKEQESVIDLPR